MELSYFPKKYYAELMNGELVFVEGVGSESFVRFRNNSVLLLLLFIRHARMSKEFCASFIDSAEELLPANAGRLLVCGVDSYCCCSYYYYYTGYVGSPRNYFAALIYC